MAKDHPTPSASSRLFDTVFGDAPGSCTPPPSEPVRFGQKHWLAQHRWLEPVVGYVGLAAALAAYLLAFQVLNRSAAVALLGIWVLFAAGAVYGRVRRPCTVMRLPVHAFIVFLAAVALAGPLGIAR